jgi:probable F420-dependent oxidoreductase
VRVDGRLDVRDLAAAPGLARTLEEMGFDGLLAGEAGYDPFLQLVLAAEHTARIQLATGVVVAFGRNPMQVALAAHELHRYSGGRFVLGLGTQVRAHIERRYGMEWSRPIARMREFVQALRAIWRCWNEGEPLDFRGEFYRHTLMSPLFEPGQDPHGAPRIYLAAIGPRMVELAGEIADGIVLHSFVTERYVRDTMIPALERGLSSSGRGRENFELTVPAFFATGSTSQELEQEEERGREHIAFYGSTPTYRRVLEAHGWGDRQPRLNALLRNGDRDGMRALIDDEMLDAFLVRGAPDEIPGKLLARYGDLVDRISFRGPYDARHPAWIEALRAAR